MIFTGAPKRIVRQRLSVVAALSVGALVLSACNSGADSPSGEKVITFGAIAPLSGAGAVYGEPQVYAMRALAEQVNAEGGLKVGDDIYTIRVVADDPQGDPAATRQIITKHIHENKIDFAISNGDPMDPISVPVTEQNSIITLDNTANKDFYSKPYKYVLNGYATPDWAALPFYETLAKLEPDIKTVHFVGVDAQFDHNHLKWSEEAALAVGWESLGQTFYEAGTLDYSAVLTAVVRKKPDLVSVGVPSGDTPNIARTLRQLGYKGIIASPIPLADMAQMVEGVGSDMDGYYQADVASYPLNDAYREFAKGYEALGVKASTTAAGYWIFFRMFLNAIQEVGSIDDPGALIEAMAGQRMATPFIDGKPEAWMGGLSRYGQVRQLALPLVVNQVVNGEIVTQATESSPSTLD